MRRWTGLAVAWSGALLLLLWTASPASAQNDLGAFGSYPAGITTGAPAPYDPYARGYQTERYGYPFTYTYQNYPLYGTPRSYSSGYFGHSYPRSYTGSYGMTRTYSPYSNYFPGYSYSARDYSAYGPLYSQGRIPGGRYWRGRW